jgi:hypothetical protein
MAFSVTDDSPSAGYIAWVDLIITKDNVDYEIDDDNSDKKYLWWDFDSPNTLQESDTMPTLNDDDGDRLIFINEDGVHQIAMQPSSLNINAIESFKGIIVMWSGAEVDIPSGWVLCDGNNSTPDLRNRFIVGAGDTYAVADTGGEDEHTLTVAEMPAHTHNYEKYPRDGDECPDNGGPHDIIGDKSGTQTATSSTGGGSAHENRPPYYALCFIMKT